jgi:hypothetical protein
MERPFSNLPPGPKNGVHFSPPDKPGEFESEHHLVHAGRRDLEVPLHVGFGERLTEDTAVGVEEGQVLTLLIGERGNCRGHAPNN